MTCPTIVATATRITHGVTSVDCQKQDRSWRLLRSLMELLIPTCNRDFMEPDEIKPESYIRTYYPRPIYTTSSVIRGTIFGYRRGKLSFCIQANPKSTTPITLLEFTATTVVLAREMQAGILRIALDCSSSDSVLSEKDQNCILQSSKFLLKDLNFLVFLLSVVLSKWAYALAYSFCSLIGYLAL
ncbi:hypothetical protein V6N13_127579 [Hibiscus sabdariffa]|uniref:Uncharacterized protein n=1 Tax=Hibiscus sabdariffa TaxID=183260 RepID=A0ABR2CD34_9ROSI